MYCSDNLDTVAAQVSCTMTQTVHLVTPNKWPMVLYSLQVARYHKVIASWCSTQMALRSNAFTIVDINLKKWSCSHGSFQSNPAQKVWSAQHNPTNV